MSDKKYYFNKTTQKAIIDYINTQDQDFKQLLYKDVIYPVFQYIINSMIKKYRVVDRIQNVDIIKESCFGWMIQKMKSFDPQRGKAFTFFTIIAKHFVLNQMNKGIKNNQRNVSINKTHQDYVQNNVMEIISVQGYEKEQLKEYNHKIYKNTMEKLKYYIEENKEQIANGNINQQIILQSIVQIIEDINRFQNYGKKFIFLYIRQLSGCSTQQIVKVLKKLKPKFEKFKEQTVQEQYYSNYF